MRRLLMLAEHDLDDVCQHRPRQRGWLSTGCCTLRLVEGSANRLGGHWIKPQNPAEALHARCMAGLGLGRCRSVRQVYV